MKNRKNLGVLFVLLLILALPALAGAERTKGWMRVRGYNDRMSVSDLRFAPRAVLPDIAHAEGIELYLKYSYYKFDTYHRAWQLELIDASGKHADYEGRVDIYLPYPSVWSADMGVYWKWTKAYAERYNWGLSRGKLIQRSKYAGFIGDNLVPIEPGTILHLKSDQYRIGSTLDTAPMLSDFGFGIHFEQGLNINCAFLLDLFDEKHEWEDGRIYVK